MTNTPKDKTPMTERSPQEIAEEIVEGYWLLRHSKDAKRAIVEALAAERQKVEEARKELNDLNEGYANDITAIGNILGDCWKIGTHWTEGVKEKIASLEAELAKIKTEGEGHFCCNGGKWRTYGQMYCSLCTHRHLIGPLQERIKALEGALRGLWECDCEESSCKACMTIWGKFISKPFTSPTAPKDSAKCGRCGFDPCECEGDSAGPEKCEIADGYCYTHWCIPRNCNRAKGKEDGK